MFGLAWLQGPVLYGGIGLLVVVIALSGALWVQSGRLEARTESLNAQKLVNSSQEARLAERQKKIEALEDTIEAQNTAIENMGRLGNLADQRQRENDLLQAELAQAKGDLKLLADKYREMRDQAVGLNTCQTYEMVLRSIADGITP